MGTSKQQAEVMGWTQTVAYTDVRISAFLGEARSDSTVTAYLTSTIGPGAGSPLATSTVSIAQTKGLPSSTEFLTLYNFDLSSSTDPVWYRGASVSFGHGVTPDGEFYANNHGDGTIDPVNPWRPPSRPAPPMDQAFTVTDTAVPKPSTIAPLGLGLGGLWIARRRSGGRWPAPVRSTGPGSAPSFSVPLGSTGGLGFWNHLWPSPPSIVSAPDPGTSARDRIPTVLPPAPRSPSTGNSPPSRSLGSRR
ncbi:MAG: PEP-CTERM sorting domain-containing protein [Verrucomicrobia bacterium]|nr:PEP-CTERM sorting domain-containing protein [Verrucomicrobiota bacterium]